MAADPLLPGVIDLVERVERALDGEPAGAGGEQEQRVAARRARTSAAGRYRLSRIEQELGRQLDDPVTIANLYLAPLVDRAGGAAGGGEV